MPAAAFPNEFRTNVYAHLMSWSERGADNQSNRCIPVKYSINYLFTITSSSQSPRAYTKFHDRAFTVLVKLIELSHAMFQGSFLS